LVEFPVSPTDLRRRPYNTLALPCECVIINKILGNNYYVEDPRTITNHFDQYFCSVGLNLQNQFKQNDGSEFRAYLNSPIKDSMFCCAVSKDEIVNIIAKFKKKHLLVLTTLLQNYLK